MRSQHHIHIALFCLKKNFWHSNFASIFRLSCREECLRCALVGESQQEDSRGPSCSLRMTVYIWASSRGTCLLPGSSEVWEQQRRRPACASVQSDQRLVICVLESNISNLFSFLASLCSWLEWFESCFVGNPSDRFSRDEAHLKVRGINNPSQLPVDQPKCF